MPKLTRQDQRPAGSVAMEGLAGLTAHLSWSNDIKLTFYAPILKCRHGAWHAASVRNFVIMRPAKGKQFSRANRTLSGGRRTQDTGKDCSGICICTLVWPASSPFFIAVGFNYGQPNALTATVVHCGQPMMLIGYDVGSSRAGMLKKVGGIPKEIIVG